MNNYDIYFIYIYDDFLENHTLSHVALTYEDMKSHVEYDFLNHINFEEWINHEVDYLNLTDDLNDRYRIYQRSIWKNLRNKKQKEFFYLVSSEYSQTLDDYLFQTPQDTLEWVREFYQDSFGSDKEEWKDEKLMIISTESIDGEPSYIITYENNEWVMNKYVSN